MKKTEAIEKAVLDMERATKAVVCAITFLTQINTQAVEGGVLTHTKRQVRNLRVVAKELVDMTELLNWEVDEEKTIAKEMDECEKETV